MLPRIVQLGLPGLTYKFLFIVILADPAFIVKFEAKLWSVSRVYICCVDATVVLETEFSKK